MKKVVAFKLLFHSLGLGCLGSSIFLQILVFRDLATQGYFLATEQNQLILSFEVFLTIVGFIYFVYVYQRLVRSLREEFEKKTASNVR